MSPFPNGCLLWPAIGRILTLMAFAAAMLAGSVRAEEVQTPPDLRNIATGEFVPSAETVRTIGFGAVIRSTSGASAKAHLRAGDIVLAVDDWRAFGFREFELARYKKATESSMVLLINRRGTLERIKITDLPPGRETELTFDLPIEETRFSDAAEALGLTLDETTRKSLSGVSPEAAAHLDSWRREQQGQKDTAWVQDFIQLHVAVQQRRYSDATAPSHSSPIPFIQRLSKFYLSYAEKNKEHEISPAQFAAYGESAEFFVLNRTLPDFHLPELGPIKLSDQKFQRLLEKRRSEGRGGEELETAARVYVNASAETTDDFLNQVRASLLDPDHHGGWPLRSVLIWKSEARQVMLNELRGKLVDTENADWAFIGYAMIGPLTLEGKRLEVAELIGKLAKRSPFFAFQGTQLYRTAIAFVRSQHGFPKAEYPWRAQVALEQAAKENGYFLGEKAPELFRWALRRIPGVKTSNQGDDFTLIPVPLLTKEPWAELQALSVPDDKKEEPKPKKKKKDAEAKEPAGA